MRKPRASKGFEANEFLVPGFGIPIALLLLRNHRITQALVEQATASMNKANTKTEPLPLDLNDLITTVRALPQEYRSQLEQPLNRVVEYTRRRRRILNLIQEALSQLRMDMKYLMFDLEATRRERDAFKNTLDDEI